MAKRAMAPRGPGSTPRMACWARTRSSKARSTARSASTSAVQPPTSREASLTGSAWARGRDAAVFPLLSAVVGGGGILSPQVHALRAAGQLLVAVGRLPRRAHAPRARGRDRPGALVAVAALPDPSQPRLCRRTLFDAACTRRGLDGELCRPAQRTADSLV